MDLLQLEPLNFEFATSDSFIEKTINKVLGALACFLMDLINILSCLILASGHRWMRTGCRQKSDESLDY